jgi:hypothetical protein
MPKATVTAMMPKRELEREQDLRLNRLDRVRPGLDRRPFNRGGRVGDDEKNRTRQDDRQRKDDEGVPDRLEIGVLGQSPKGFHEPVFQPIHDVHGSRLPFIIVNT